MRSDPLAFVEPLTDFLQLEDEVNIEVTIYYNSNNDNNNYYNIDYAYPAASCMPFNAYIGRFRVGVTAKSDNFWKS